MHTVTMMPSSMRSLEFHPHHLPPNLPGLEYAGYLDFPATRRQVCNDENRI